MAKEHREIDFDVWGCRGSRNLVPGSSDIGENTSCYSVLAGRDLFVLDAGRGLTRLGRASIADERFAAVERVHVLITHAHMDHWEGLKDVEWFWTRDNDKAVTLFGTDEALSTVESGFGHPSYVPLQILSSGNVRELVTRRLKAGESLEFDGCHLETIALHHYSGDRSDPQYLDTVGYRLKFEEGAVVVYLSDHEPNTETRATEDRAIQGSRLVVLDSHFLRIQDHAFGHGSQEHAARLAADHPEALLIAGHLNPNLDDEQIKQTNREFGKGLENFLLAREGEIFRWDSGQDRFRRV